MCRMYMGTFVHVCICACEQNYTIDVKVSNLCACIRLHTYGQKFPFFAFVTHIHVCVIIFGVDICVHTYMNI